MVCIGYFEDDTLQIGYDFVLVKAGQLCHVLKVNLALCLFGSNRNGKGINGCSHLCDRVVCFDSSLAENIRLADVLPFFVKAFQRFQQRERGIVLENIAVFLIPDKAVFGGKIIIEGCQCSLYGLYLCVRNILVKLHFQKLTDSITDSNQRCQLFKAFLFTRFCKFNRL